MGYFFFQLAVTLSMKRLFVQLEEPLCSFRLFPVTGVIFKLW
jgi:hypothetical protein